MDAQVIRKEAAYLLMLAGLERDMARAGSLRDRANVLEAQAEHLERTGHYIELPGKYVRPEIYERWPVWL